MKQNWPEIGLELVEITQGLRVRQGLNGQSLAYVARGFRLTAEILNFVELCIESGLVCAIQNNHPRKENLGEDGKGVDYLSFSKIHDELWVCCMDSRSFQGGQEKGKLVDIGIRKQYSKALIDNKIPYAWETGGGKNCRVAVTHAAVALRAITGKVVALNGEVHDLEVKIRLAMNDDPLRRVERLRNAPRIPEKLEVTRTEFQRNPDVVAEVYLRAKGICSQCNSPAPFKRRADGLPYLEIHHKVPLAAGGEDTVENAVALCPNCHRKAHYG